MRWARPASTALVVGIALGACAKFGEAPAETGSADASSGDGAAMDGATPGKCAVDSCEGRGASCRAYTFADSPCPPNDWTFSTDNLPGAVHECSGGYLHIAARDTLDVVAELDLGLPKVLDVIRVSLRFSVNAWDGKALFDVGGWDLVHFEVTAIGDARGELELALCVATRNGPTDCIPIAVTTLVDEHVLLLELDRNGVVASLDCGPPVSRQGKAFEGGGSFVLGFGHADGDPFDGTLAATTISFR